MTIDSNLAQVDEVMTALYDIFDPEIGMSIVDLDLIKHVEIGSEGTPTKIKMVLTTPFCPWAGELIQTVKEKTEEVVGPPVKVTLLADRWELRMLSSTISLAYLASGRIGAYYLPTLSSPVHAAAGALLSEEAGAIVTDREGVALAHRAELL